MLTFNVQCSPYPLLSTLTKTQKFSQSPPTITIGKLHYAYNTSCIMLTWTAYGQQSLLTPHSICTSSPTLHVSTACLVSMDQENHDINTIAITVRFTFEWGRTMTTDCAMPGNVHNGHTKPGINLTAHRVHPLLLPVCSGRHPVIFGVTGKTMQVTDQMCLKKGKLQSFTYEEAINGPTDHYTST
ncbi:uncharacterized protein LACBIDRAFT_323390 [Laccaria bicolor S238N-H82]|uniref:Predicted protein n=1 Tax=Laccaria bicolor (strain S238N-H82 / ATCC MYA-4686) TaxID=486041 RepID=B0CXG3_LACBS|nr:uncharacterized protein LACBIDRAFT_323390 [Laccaria bicolor S238N-H82]EDR12256.1 predicted protein [Laccaria bicolor S238N-H82]|eukprot:XP_001876520.1 predicted protein [Laccaria bicolor S238N-H82]